MQKPSLAYFPQQIVHGLWLIGNFQETLTIYCFYILKFVSINTDSLGMKTLLIGLLLVLSACTTTTQHLTDAESAWIVMNNGIDKTPYWCTIKKEATDPGPACFEAKIMRKPLSAPAPR